MNYWKNRYDHLLDYLKEEYGAAFVLAALSDVDKRTGE
jgi:hypothetical protein